MSIKCSEKLEKSIFQSNKIGRIKKEITLAATHLDYANE